MGAAPLLRRFVEWDQVHIDTPIDYFPPTRDVAWKSHVLAIRRDLTYLTPTGYKLRQIITDTEMRLDRPESELFAAAMLACSDADLGVGRVEQIEAWQLRYEQRQAWGHGELLLRLPDLEAILDDVTTMFLEGS